MVSPPCFLASFFSPERELYGCPGNRYRDRRSRSNRENGRDPWRAVLGRVYTANEIEHCIQAANSVQNFSTRWAAKEAVMKALRCRQQGVRWTDIEIMVSPGSGPRVVLAGSAMLYAQHCGIEKLHVSLGACRTHATAYVIATDELD